MIISAYDRIEDIRSLFSEYTNMLVSINPEFHLYLEIQHYDDEKENPSLKYALPMEGFILIFLMMVSPEAVLRFVSSLMKKVRSNVFMSVLNTGEMVLPQRLSKGLLKTLGISDTRSFILILCQSLKAL